MRRARKSAGRGVERMGALAARSWRPRAIIALLASDCAPLDGAGARILRSADGACLRPSVAVSLSAPVFVLALLSVTPLCRHTRSRSSILDSLPPPLNAMPLLRAPAPPNLAAWRAKARNHRARRLLGRLSTARRW